MAKQILTGTVRGLKQRPEPPEGRQCIQLDPLNFVTGTEVFQFNTSSVNAEISGVRSMWVDASGCTPGKKIFIETIYQTFVVVGGKQGYITVVADIPFLMNVSCEAGMAGPVNINLLNFGVQPGDAWISV